ncbi:myc-associated zinc finger protein-like [Nasonia vitripennis]|uniref:C2H2-type domain-containing protein n=1 Tax=Nasonia vitripennis TaxID=7425 RepID=A0A7M7QYF6_NASVI|nr:myc-associated zinc finger protein-like [Nasonia vitripennis]XP_032456441.1 myc-associated zinc finger protein-like [Nasonia vitripennis]
MYTICNNAKNKETQQWAYVCGTCHKGYSWKKSLLRHLREAECGINVKYGCKLCSKQYKRKDVLNQHIASVHSNANRKSGL